MDSNSQVAQWATHKDAPAHKTIDRARRLLKPAGFNPCIVAEYQAFPGCFSCHLAEPTLAPMFSNGKGCTRELALASAYGEFIERLQCYCDVRLRHLGLIVSKSSFFFPKSMPTELVVDSHPQIMKELLPPGYYPPVDELECLEFCDLTEDRIIWLPYDLMLKLTQSNGMCAGNTPEEALVQGCCEVMERAVIQRLATGKLRGLPTIPLEELPLGRGVARKLVEELLARGLKVFVKDATLGGRWPVLAVIILEEKTGDFALGFGADPVMEVALARCITEALQGRSKQVSHNLNQMSSLIDLPVAWYYYQPQLTVWALLENPPATGNFRQAFLPPTASNFQMLKHLLQQLKCEGRRVMVRDFSFLGMPTYYVYITGLSRMFTMDEGALQLLLKDYRTVLETFFSLPWASPEQLRSCSRLLCAQLWRPREMSLEQIVENLFAMVPVMEWMDLRLVLAIMLMEVQDWFRAAQVLRSPFVKERFFQPPDPQMLEVMIAVCELKAEGLGNQEISRRIGESLAYNPYAASAGHLVRGHYASFLAKDPEGAEGKGLEGLPIPRCTSLWNCRDCGCRKTCYVKGWLKISRGMEKLARPVDQRHLLKRLGRLVNQP
ncbi:YcaO-type kinase domain-containing protein [Desulfonauticus submarinus]|uniref:YcaO-type kinase domain-containing protein n=1 Tax=Desulfonauticus submarinus TaxID=206665 RepID=A0A1H0CWI6_9BACT|nr:YcaO-like family protein [Desulfonauticus submarinus]SDN62283.1 YcaO-type kinase domain-containing protein [Desulfonauticus submarinus]